MRSITNRASFPSLHLLFYSEFFHKKECFHTNQLNSGEEEEKKPLILSHHQFIAIYGSFRFLFNWMWQKRTGKEETQRDNYGFKVLNSRYILASVVALILNEICVMFLCKHILWLLYAGCWLRIFKPLLVPILTHIPQ